MAIRETIASGNARAYRRTITVTRSLERDVDRLNGDFIRLVQEVPIAAQSVIRLRLRAAFDLRDFGFGGASFSFF